MPNIYIVGGYIILALIITFLEHIFYRLRWHNKLILSFKQIFEVPYTMVHEFSHAFLALVTSGKVYKMTLHYDLSGSVLNSTSNWLARVLTTYAGYTGPCLVSYLLYYFLQNKLYDYILISFLIMAIVSFIFIRNWYGFIWLSGFISLLIYCGLSKNEQLIMHSMMFLSAIVLVGTVYSGYRVLLISFKEPRENHDASILAKYTFLPAQFWGVIFCAQSFASGIIIVLKFLV